MSASVKSNKLPIVVAVLAVVLLTGVGISQCTRSNTVTTTSPAAAVATPTVPSRPSDADGKDETLRTLAARLGAVESVAEQQKVQDAKVEALNQQIVEARENNSNTELLATLQQLQAQNSQLTDRLLALETKQATPSDAAINEDFGIPQGAVPNQLGALAGAAGISNPSAVGDNGGAPIVADTYIWQAPLDRAPMLVGEPGSASADGTIGTAPGEIQPIAPGVGASSNARNRGDDASAITPRFTLPANATLLNNQAMTALIGRLPVGGSLPDPYRFKVIASAEGLATNGFYLPTDIEAMVFSGTASGDWNLSCVRGEIDSVTFTYEDGSVQTYGGEIAQAEGTGQARARRALGYISDPSGVPCIKGERVTNAPKVLGARMAAAALEATARGYAEAQTTTSQTGLGGVVRTIDDAAKFGGYTGLAGGAADARSWLDSRMGQIFDAVYAPPGQRLAIHIESQINLDQRGDARKLVYDAPHTSTSQLD
jgi:integrating conjugative element protein (TIGR03752 family)